MAKQIVILSGLPAAGKTQYAKNWLSEDSDGRIRVNYDDLRLGMYGPDWKWNRADEDKMKAHAKDIATRALTAGLSVIIDNTNLSSRARNEWQALGQKLGAQVVAHCMVEAVSECVRRDKLREGRARVGRAIIEGMAFRQGLLDFDRACVLVDIDGTLADCAHRLHYIKNTIPCPDCSGGLLGACIRCKGARKVSAKKDWKGFFEDVANDKPIPLIIDLVTDMSKRYDIVIVTGRNMSIAKQTEDWLDKHCPFPIKYLLMRQDNDHTPSAEAKAEIVRRIPADKIVAVIDDRPADLAMYRTLGHTTIDVGQGFVF